MENMTFEEWLDYFNNLPDEELAKNLDAVLKILREDRSYSVWLAALLVTELEQIIKENTENA